MSEEKQIKIDIPESIESYKVTLFWGLTITQIILVFIATLFTGFAIFSLASRHFMGVPAFLLVTGFSLLGIVEIHGRNFYRHISFIMSYYQRKPRVLIYNHYAISGASSAQAKQLVYQKESNKKTFIIIFIALALGLILLILIAFYLYHVLHT